MFVKAYHAGSLQGQKLDCSKRLGEGTEVRMATRLYESLGLAAKQKHSREQMFIQGFGHGFEQARRKKCGKSIKS